MARRLATIVGRIAAASLVMLPLAPALAAPAGAPAASRTAAAGDSLESQFDRLLGAAARAPRAGPSRPASAPASASASASASGPVVLLPARARQAAVARAAVAGTGAPERFADLPPPLAPRSGDALEVQLAALAGSGQGRIGVAALDLATGRTVDVLGNQPFPMASTSKIAIVATFLAGVDQGRWSLTDRFPLMIPLPSARFSTAVAPVRRGAELTALQLIELAITRSNNEATDALLAAVGGPAAVTRWVRSTTGIDEFRLDRDIATLVRDDGAVNPAITIDRRDSITPAAMVRLLAGLHQGTWLTPASRDVLLGAMSRCVTGRHRMRAMLPEGTAIAHKTGTLFNTASDVGFIETPDGRKLAVAIYVTGQGGKPGRESRIALLARTIFDGYTVDRPQRAALR